MPPRLLKSGVLKDAPRKKERVAPRHPSPLAMTVMHGKFVPVMTLRCIETSNSGYVERLVVVRTGAYTFGTLSQMAGIDVSSVEYEVHGRARRVSRGAGADTLTVVVDDIVLSIDDRPITNDMIRRLAHDVLVENRPCVLPGIAFNYDIENRRVCMYYGDRCILYIEGD